MEQLDYTVVGYIHPLFFSSSVRLPGFWVVTQMLDREVGAHRPRVFLLVLLDWLGAD